MACGLEEITLARDHIATSFLRGAGLRRHAGAKPERLGTRRGEYADWPEQGFSAGPPSAEAGTQIQLHLEDARGGAAAEDALRALLRPLPRPPRHPARRRRRRQRASARAAAAAQGRMPALRGGACARALQGPARPAAAALLLRAAGPHGVPGRGRARLRNAPIHGPHSRLHPAAHRDAGAQVAARPLCQVPRPRLRQPPGPARLLALRQRHGAAAGQRHALPGVCAAALHGVGEHEDVRGG